uniref:Apoptin n=1 Tax=Gyrovirus GyV9 TaxID=1682185 RepID=A0A0H4U5B6_9VIRU|nr:VP3 [Gyrovirus GyV9]
MDATGTLLPPQMQIKDTESGQQVTESRRLTSSWQWGTTVSKSLLIGIGPATIELSLPGYATVDYRTTRYVSAANSEATGSSSALDLRKSPQKRKSCSCALCLNKENAQEGGSNTSKRSKKAKSGPTKKGARL